MPNFKQSGKSVPAYWNCIGYHLDVSHVQRGESFRTDQLLQSTEEPTMLHLDDGASAFLEQLKAPRAGYDEIVVSQDPSDVKVDLAAPGQAGQELLDFPSSIYR